MNVFLVIGFGVDRVLRTRSQDGQQARMLRAGGRP